MNRPLVVVPLVLLVVVLSSLGQTWLKLAINRLQPGQGPVDVVLALLTQPFFWMGGLAVVAGMACWLYTLARADLTYASPFLALGFVVTMITSAVILQESQPMGRILGTLVVVGGMLLVGFSR